MSKDSEFSKALADAHYRRPRDTSNASWLPKEDWFFHAGWNAAKAQSLTPENMKFIHDQLELLIEYAQCNDPLNPHLYNAQDALALLTLEQPNE